MTAKILSRVFRTGLVIAAILFPPASTPAENKPYTVLVYLNGSDLEGDFSAATNNLKEMMIKGTTNAVNIVVETGGTKIWRNPYVSPDSTQRWLITHGSMQRLDDGRLGQRDMSKPEYLADFISWGVKNYPADRYALILWDHGSGPLGGFGVDQNYGGSELKLNHISSAVASAAAATGVKLELIGFDTCLLGNLELASKLSPHARYMVGSEELEPHGSWDYQAIIGAVDANHKTQGDELGRKIVDSYIAKSKSQNKSNLTLSVIDLEKVPALVQEINKISENMNSVLGSRWTSLSKARDETIYYNDVKADIIDAGSWVKSLNKRKLLNAEDTSSALGALSGAVIYNKTDRLKQGSTGLSIYFPHRNKQEFKNNLDKYSSIGIAPAYTSLVSSYSSKMLTDNGPVPFSNDTPTYLGNASSPAHPIYQVSTQTEDLEERLRLACANLYSSRYFDSKMPLSSDCDVKVDVQNGAISYVFDQKWPLLKDQPLSIDQIDIGKGSVIDRNDPTKRMINFSVPIQIKRESDADFRDASITIQYDPIKKIFHPVKQADLDSRSLSEAEVVEGKADIKITPATQVKIKRRVLNLDGSPVSPPKYEVGPAFVVGKEGLTVKDTKVPPGAYSIEFSIVGVNGSVAKSKRVEIKY